jgi:hypothetical protein
VTAVGAHATWFGRDLVNRWAWNREPISLVMHRHGLKIVRVSTNS